MKAAAFALMMVVVAAETLLVAPEPRVEDGLLTLTVPTPGTVNAQLAGQLKNGLTHRLRYTLVLRVENDPNAVLTETLTTEVVYDLWEEGFVVSYAQSGRVRTLRVKTEERVRALLERPRFRAIVSARALDPAKRYTADVKVEVNPISQEVLERTKRLLSPPPRDSDSGATRGFLGNVVSIFINDAHTTTPVLLYRTRPFAVPPPGGAK